MGNWRRIISSWLFKDHSRFLRQGIYEARRCSLLLGFSSLFLASSSAAEGANLESAFDWRVVYQNDFRGLDINVDPQGIFVLNGEFRTVYIEGNGVLRLPGDPVGEFGILFGPRSDRNVSVRLRTLARPAGRRMPTFGVGLFGRSGPRLYLKPAARSIQIIRNGIVLATESFHWKPGNWTWCSIQATQDSQGGWMLEGRVWYDGEAEPRVPAITVPASRPQRAGKASLWGIPYAGTPIDFDDLEVQSAFRKKPE